MPLYCSTEENKCTANVWYTINNKCVIHNYWFLTNTKRNIVYHNSLTTIKFLSNFLAQNEQGILWRCFENREGTIWTLWENFACSSSRSRWSRVVGPLLMYPRSLSSAAVGRLQNRRRTNPWRSPVCRTAQPGRGNTLALGLCWAGLLCLCCGSA